MRRELTYDLAIPRTVERGLRARFPSTEERTVGHVLKETSASHAAEECAPAFTGIRSICRMHEERPAMG